MSSWVCGARNMVKTLIMLIFFAKGGMRISVIKYSVQPTLNNSLYMCYSRRAGLKVCTLDSGSGFEPRGSLRAFPLQGLRRGSEQKYSLSNKSASRWAAWTT